MSSKSEIDVPLINMTGVVSIKGDIGTHRHAHPKTSSEDKSPAATSQGTIKSWERGLEQILP